ITMDRNKTITANFSQIYYSISATTGNGTFSFNPPLDSFLQGSEVVVTAIGNLGYGFHSWGGDLSGNENPAKIIMDGDKTISADFVEVPTYTLTLNTEYGSVALNPPGGEYNPGTEVTLTPEPNPGYYFGQWFGDVEGSENPATITMDKNKTVDARFVFAGFGKVSSAINFGGSDYEATDGTSFTGNQDGNKYSTTSDISGTEDDQLYQTERFGSNFSIDLPVENGAYQVTLMFAEIYHSSAGNRVFNVSIEGKQVINNLDIYAKAGKNAAYNETHEVTISDGEINIAFTTVSDNAKISAIKIVSDTFEGETFALTTDGLNGTIEAGSAEGSYPAGSNVVLTATPDPGYKFDGWSGDLSGTENPVTLYMNSDKNISATFVETTWYTLATSAVNGSISVTPGKGIYGYTEGTVVSLTASPDAGYYFTGWAGDLEGVDKAAATILMDADKNVIANFEKKQFYTLSTSAANGSIALNPAGGYYEEGTLVNVTAIPNSGYTFSGWQGDLSGIENPVTIVMDTDKNILAKFSNPNALKLTIIAVNGSVQATPNLDSYPKGASVILVATPDDGYQFTGWEGDLTGSSNPVGFLINHDKDITAVFSKITGISDFITDQPSQTILLQNYPNPFSGITTIPYHLASHAKVKLNVNNMLGECVATLVNEYQPPGDYAFQWNVGDIEIGNVSSAFYFYSLETDNDKFVKKMILKK
ncbi:MAG: malectin domain-containing carbohydrate-binding protein, partial [Bacteroidales bacterium]